MIINTSDAYTIDYIAKEARNRRSDLPLFSVHIERSYPQQGTAWDDGAGSGWSPWIVIIVTIDKAVNETQMVTQRHHGKGFSLTEAAEMALSKLSQYEAKHNSERLPLKPWLSDHNKDQGKDQGDLEPEDEPDFEWVRDEVKKRLDMARSKD